MYRNHSQPCFCKHNRSASGKYLSFQGYRESIPYGTTNGNDMTFTTPPILPVVVTTAATGVGSTTATLNGTVDAGGASTTVTFDYGLTTTYGTTVPGVPGTVTGNTVTPVSAYISGLTLNTTYHYRIKGVNSVGTVNGTDMTFTTNQLPDAWCSRYDNRSCDRLREQHRECIFCGAYCKCNRLHLVSATRSSHYCRNQYKQHYCNVWQYFRECFCFWYKYLW